MKVLAEPLSIPIIISVMVLVAKLIYNKGEGFRHKKGILPDTWKEGRDEL